MDIVEGLQGTKNLRPTSGDLFLFPRRRRFLLLTVAVRRRGFFAYRQAERFLHVILDLAQQFRMILQSLLRILTALAEAFALVRKPRAAFFNHAIVGSEIP